MSNKILTSILIIILFSTICCCQESNKKWTGPTHKISCKNETLVYFSIDINDDTLYGFKGFVLDTVRDGRWQIYFDEKKTKLAEELFIINGKLNGKRKQWTKNGLLVSEDNFKDGKREGLSRNWHSNGKISYEANFKKGLFYSEALYWDENGNLERKEIYTENGIKIKEAFYEKGYLYKEEYFKDQKPGAGDVYLIIEYKANGLLENVYKIEMDTTFDKEIMMEIIQAKMINIDSLKSK